MKVIASEFKAHKDALITGKDFTLEKLKFLFPQTYREELINFLEKFPENKALAIVDGIDFTNFDFIDPHNKDYVFKSISRETALGKKLFSEFESEAIRIAESGGEEYTESCRVFI